MSAHGARVARAFDRAWAYDDAAVVQRAVADWLAERIVATGPHDHVLEIGCGTGALAARAALPSAARSWVLTDIAPAMLERSRARLGDGAPFAYRRMDGEHPDPRLDGSLDLVCSSLAAQWFGNLEAALARQMRLLRPGGRLLLTTLLDGSFAEWISSVRAAGGTPGTPAFPTVGQLEAMHWTSPPAIARRRFEAHAASGLEALRAVKRIGAGTSRPDARPLTPAILRDALRRFEASGSVLGYEVAMIELRAEERA